MTVSPTTIPAHPSLLPPDDDSADLTAHRPFERPRLALIVGEGTGETPAGARDTNARVGRVSVVRSA